MTVPPTVCVVLIWIQIYSGKPPFSHIPEAAIIYEGTDECVHGGRLSLGRVIWGGSAEVVDRCLITEGGGQIGRDGGGEDA